MSDQRKVAVVYYLSNDGHLEHPHFMEVPLSSPSVGLHLRDVICRLNALRGRAMASMYSWSSKRRYKNGFVWHDLSEEDFIHPVHGDEYVLKGTELVTESASASVCRPGSTTAAVRSCVHVKPPRIPEPRGGDSAASVARMKKATCSSTSSSSRVTSPPETAVETVDAWTQTDDRTRPRQVPRSRPENPDAELDKKESQPRPSSASSTVTPETVEAMINKDRCHSGRMKASAVLMDLFSCGSTAVMEQELSLVP